MVFMLHGRSINLVSDLSNCEQRSATVAHRFNRQRCEARLKPQTIGGFLSSAGQGEGSQQRAFGAVSARRRR